MVFFSFLDNFDEATWSTKVCHFPQIYNLSKWESIIVSNYPLSVSWSRFSWSSLHHCSKQLPALQGGHFPKRWVLRWKTCLDLILSFRAVCPVIKRCKNRDRFYVLRSKKVLLRKEKKGRVTCTCLFEEWLQTQNLSTQRAQPWERRCKVGCVSQVTSDLSFGLLGGCPWWVWQELGIHPLLQHGECSVLGSGFSSSELKYLTIDFLSLWVYPLKLSEYFLTQKVWRNKASQQSR